MAWTGFATDLTLIDVAGPLYPIPVQATAAPKPVASTAPAAPPKPVATATRHAPATPTRPASHYLVAACVLAILPFGLLTWHFGAPTSGEPAVRAATDISTPAATAQHAPAKGHGKRESSAQPAHANEHPAPATQTHARAHAQPHTTTRSAPRNSEAATEAGESTGGEVGKDMTLEHFRDLSGKI
jgi:hypothetical protein